MDLRITDREVQGVTVVALDGRIVFMKEANALRERMKTLVAEGKKHLVLNMSKVTMIDSAGLGALVAAYSSAKSSGASLRLCNLSTFIHEMLQITKLLPIFNVSKTEEDAVRSFSE